MTLPTKSTSLIGKRFIFIHHDHRSIGDRDRLAGSCCLMFMVMAAAVDDERFTVPANDRCVWRESCKRILRLRLLLIGLDLPDTIPVWNHCDPTFIIHIEGIITGIHACACALEQHNIYNFDNVGHIYDQFFQDLFQPSNKCVRVILSERVGMHTTKDK